jgi:hypothetical protein
MDHSSVHIGTLVFTGTTMYMAHIPSLGYPTDSTQLYGVTSRVTSIRRTILAELIDSRA